MCLTGSASSVEQHAKKIDLKDVAKGKQPPATILAWRAWNVAKYDVQKPPQLRSVSQSTLWTPGKIMKADTIPLAGTSHTGFHAYKTIEDLIAENQVPSKTDFKQLHTVVGQVVLFGKIAEHPNGYRAEFAYPFRLYANGPGFVVQLAEIYGCVIGRDFIPRLLKAA